MKKIDKPKAIKQPTSEVSVEPYFSSQHLAWLQFRRRVIRQYPKLGLVTKMKKPYVRLYLHFIMKGKKLSKSLKRLKRTKAKRV